MKKGSGIIATIGKHITAPKLDGYTNEAQKYLKMYGDVPVVKLEIYRTPLHNMLTKAIDFISSGKFSQLQKKMGYDKFFHLALVATLNNKKKIIIQKLDVIDVSPSFKTHKDTEVEYVEQYEFRGTENEEDYITINELFSNAREHVNDKLWFGYNSLSNNCQWYIKYILQYSDLYGPSEEKFLFQNIETLVKELPEYVKDTMNLVTDTAATVTKLRGKGSKKYTVKEVHF
jgi:hypothetical protein